MNIIKPFVVAITAAAVVNPVASFAAATLFGSVQLYAQQQSAKQKGGKSNTQFADNGSDVGVKGSSNLGHGVTGFYKIDLNVDVFNGVSPGSGGNPYSGGSPNLNTNLGYMGFKGSFGKVVAGRQHTLFYSMIESPTDTPNVLAGPLNPIKFVVYGKAGGYKSKAPSIAYRSPNINGFTAGVAYLDIGTYNGTAHPSATGKQQGVYQLGGKYRFSSGYVSAGYMGIPQDNARLGSIKDVWGLAGGYMLGAFGLDGNFIRLTPRTNGAFALTGANNSKPADSFAIQGSYTKGPWYGYLEYSELKWKHISDKTATRTVVGVFYQVANPLQLTFELSRNNKYVASNLATSSTAKAYTTFAVGSTYSF